MQQQITSNKTTTPTANQSLSLVKNLLGTTIGAIAYLRNLFPEDNFRDTSINGLALKSLVRDYSLEADELMDWMEKGVFNALEKKYLKTMVFGIFLDPNEPDKLVEGYTFGFSYPAENQWCITLNESEKQTFSLKTKTEIMRATTEMLRRLLVLTQTLEPLPQNAYVTMKLFYYEDTTPIDYQPPFFQPSDEARPYYFEESPENISIGKVESPHHMLTLSIQSVSPPNPDERGPPRPLKKHLYNIDVEEEDAASLRKDDTQVIGPINLEEDEGPMITPPPTRARPSPVSQKRKCVLSNTVDSCQTQDDTQELIERLKLGPAESAVLPDAPPPSMVSLDMACDTIPEVNNDNGSFNLQDLANSQESIISLLQESGTRPTRQRVAQILQPETNQASRSMYCNDPLAGIDHILDAPDLEKEKNGVDIQCPCLIRKDLSYLSASLELTQCKKCRTYCHSACIGFVDTIKQTRTLCYSCRSVDLPEKLGEIAFLRLGLAIVWDVGIESRTWLSKTLNVQLPVSNQLITSLQRRGFVGKGTAWAKSKKCFTAIKTPSTEKLRDKLFSDAALHETFGQTSAPVKQTKTDSVPDSDKDIDMEVRDAAKPLPPKMTTRGSRIGKTWSTATTVLSIEQSPILSAKSNVPASDMDQFEIPASQMDIGNYGLSGSQESVVVSLQGQHAPKKRRKVSVVKKTIAVL